MNVQLQDLCASKANREGIYDGLCVVSTDQVVEIDLRERVASAHYADYLLAISRSHSIPVMDREVDTRCLKVP